MLERLSWKRLLTELALVCLPALVLGLLVGYLPWWLLLAVGDRRADLAFLEPAAPLPVAVG